MSWETFYLCILNDDLCDYLFGMGVWRFGEAGDYPGRIAEPRILGLSIWIVVAVVLFMAFMGPLDDCGRCKYWNR